MLRSTTTPREKIETIIGALKELPQRFIWKWEEDSLPGNPPNIYLSKWLPQNEILSKYSYIVEKLPQLME